MAQRVTVELEDDLDGGPADETLRFGLGGSDYEIDLNKKNASTFRRDVDTNGSISGSDVNLTKGRVGSGLNP